MISTTLSLWGKGAVTLPKKWRDRFQTKNFLAEEDAGGNLVIKPLEDVIYYEKNGRIGLHFPRGMDGHEFLARLKKAEKSLRKKEIAERK